MGGGEAAREAAGMRWWLVGPIRVLSAGVDGQGVQVVGQDRPAGPDSLALVTPQAAAAQVVAALEVADAALAAGAVAGQPPAGAAGAGLGPSRDERPGGCQPGQGLGGGAWHEAAIQGDLAWPKPQAVQLGRGLGQQAVLGRIARRAGRRQQVPAGAATGVGGDLGELGDISLR
jgi:hypothetical protein